MSGLPPQIGTSGHAAHRDERPPPQIGSYNGPVRPRPSFYGERVRPEQPASGFVREWSDEAGWGVLDSPATPGGCFAHFAVIAAEDPRTFRTLSAGDAVDFVFERFPQDVFDYRATWVQRVDRQRAMEVLVGDDSDLPNRAGVLLQLGHDPTAGEDAVEDEAERSPECLTCGSSDVVARIDFENPRRRRVSILTPARLCRACLELFQQERTLDLATRRLQSPQGWDFRQSDLAALLLGIGAAVATSQDVAP